MCIEYEQTSVDAFPSKYLVLYAALFLYGDKCLSGKHLYVNNVLVNVFFLSLEYKIYCKFLKVGFKNPWQILEVEWYTAKNSRKRNKYLIITGWYFR